MRIIRGGRRLPATAIDPEIIKITASTSERLFYRDSPCSFENNVPCVDIELVHGTSRPYFQPRQSAMNIPPTAKHIEVVSLS